MASIGMSAALVSRSENNVLSFAQKCTWETGTISVDLSVCMLGGIRFPGPYSRILFPWMRPRRLGAAECGDRQKITTPCFLRGNGEQLRQLILDFMYRISER